MKIIAFSGKKQSGKTTAARFLAARWATENREQGLRLGGGRVQICGFADELKRIVLHCFCLPECDWGMLDFDKEEVKHTTLPCGKTARELLQVIGTDWFRELWPDVWLNALWRYMKTYRDDCFVVPDARFPNEVKCIQDLGGHVIRLLRNPFPDDQHESETVLNWLDGEYYNPPETKAAKQLYTLHFDAFIDNREMTIGQQNDAVWKLVTERKWI